MKHKSFVALLAGSTIWCLSIIAAPLLNSAGIYAFFSHICHQDPSRSLHIFGEPLAVCIRCTAIYFAFAVSLWSGFRASARWLRAAVVLLVLEFALARLVIDAAALRAFSGILIGLSAAPFVRQGLEEISESM